MMRLAPAPLAFALVALAASSARADEPTAHVAFDALGGVADLDGYTLHTSIGQDTPDPLKDKHLLLRGAGAMLGGEMRITVIGSASNEVPGRTRGGIAFAFYGVDHARLEHDPLPGGLTIDPAKLWGAHIELFLGEELQLVKRRRGDGVALLRPYAELRAMLSFLQTGLSLRHPSLGLLGSTSFDAYSFGLGPRLGIEIALARHAFLDLGAYGSVVGFERAGGFAGLSFGDR